MAQIRQSSNNPLYKWFDWLVETNGIDLIIRYTRVTSCCL